MTTNTEIMVRAVRDLVTRSLSPFVVRLREIEAWRKEIDARPVPKDGEPGKDGRDGRDADMDAVKTLIKAQVDAIPRPADGARGRDGKDADPVDVEALAQDVLRRIPAPKDGKDGKDGTDGKDGSSVPREEVMEMVKAAIAEIPIPQNGRDGIDGKDAEPVDLDALVARVLALVPSPQDGRDGLEGQPGRDALQIEIEPQIDPVRRYARGTYAHFRGGLVRSFKTTEPMAEGSDMERCGWAVIVRGMDAMTVDLADDMRTLSVSVTMTDGARQILTKTIPVVIYRGIWRDDGDYAKGDSVTRDGATWVLMSDGQTGKPGDEKSGWILSTKRGRDGRDATIPAKPGPVRL